MSGLWDRVRCRFGLHRRLDVIQSFGSAQRIGCPHCGKQMGIHHRMGAVVPWGAEFSDLYDLMGYETEAAHAKWQAYRRAAGYADATP